MTVSNHMMTGAFIAVIIRQPALAIPLAFVSHFVVDMVPHYGYGKVPFHERDAQKHFLLKQVVDTYAGVGLFWMIPYLLREVQAPWIIAWSMFAATVPDAYWAIQYAVAKRKGTYPALNRYARFHKAIQWCERPWGAYVELAWFIGIGLFLKSLLS